MYKNKSKTNLLENKYYIKVNELLHLSEHDNLDNFDKNSKKYFMFDKPKCNHCFDYSFKNMFNWLDYEYKIKNNIELDSSKYNFKNFNENQQQFIFETTAYIYKLCCLKNYSTAGFIGCQRDYGQDITDITFNNSIDIFFKGLIESKYLKEIGTFIGHDKLVFRCILDDNGKMYSCLDVGEQIYNTLPGKWTVYASFGETHWDSKDGDAYDSWNNTAFVINDNFKSDSLDTLSWVGAVVYAQHSIDIFSSKIFCDKSTLKCIMGDTNEKGNYCEILEKYMYSEQNENSGEYFFLPDGCVLSAPEKRQRMVFYGKDANNNVLALYIPTLG